MKVLFDGNNLAFRCLHSKHVNFGDLVDFKMWRYSVFNSIYTFLRAKNNKAIDEVILAFDASNSWRYLVYPKYKAHRKAAKEKTGIDFERFFVELNDLIDKFQQYLPFKTIKVDRTEADDIIATLVLETDGKKVIVSRDEDFIQLIPKAKLYNPFTRKFIEETDIKKFLLEKICIGQPKDNIPNIKTPNDWPEDKKKPSFGKKTFDKMYEDYTLDDLITEHDYNFRRNKRLIDFNEIPNVIKTAVLKKYNEYQKPKGDAFLKLFEIYNWENYLNNITQVEPVMFRVS